ncbi:hypothetical protein MPER_07314, partial [Moniliophthora perniciosa FA553]
MQFKTLLVFLPLAFASPIPRSCAGDSNCDSLVGRQTDTSGASLNGIPVPVGGSDVLGSLLGPVSGLASGGLAGRDANAGLPNLGSALPVNVVKGLPLGTVTNSLPVGDVSKGLPVGGLAGRDMAIKDTPVDGLTKALPVGDLVKGLPVVGTLGGRDAAINGLPTDNLAKGLPVGNLLKGLPCGEGLWAVVMH